MSQYDVWQHILLNAKTWKTVQVALKHMMQIEKRPMRKHQGA